MTQVTLAITGLTQVQYDKIVALVGEVWGDEPDIGKEFYETLKQHTSTQYLPVMGNRQMIPDAVDFIIKESERKK